MVVYWFSWKMHQLLPWKWQEKLGCVSLPKSKFRPKIRIIRIFREKKKRCIRKRIIFLNLKRWIELTTCYPFHVPSCYKRGQANAYSPLPWVSLGSTTKYSSPITSSSSNYNIRFAFLPNQAPCLCIVYLWSKANVVCHLIYCYTGMSFGIQIRHTRPSPPETKRYLQDW